MLYINGEWRESLSGKTLDVTNPATNQTIKSVPSAGVEETKQAIDAAKQAFAGWKRLTGKERSQYLRKVADHLRDNQDALAGVVTTEMGKPLKEAKGELALSIDYFEWYAEEAKRIYGETIPSFHPDKRLMLIQQPVGVVAAVTPWNFPVAMFARKIAPALAAGCTIVLKPASATPLSAIKVFESFEAAGIPKGVVNLVIGSASEIVGEMTRNPDVKKITFTGSTEVGKKLIRDSADTVKRVSMELGGHAPFVVFDDADIDAAVEGAIASKFRNAGQTCVCLNRLYVSETVAEEFGRKFADKVSQLKLGSGLDAGVDIGPLIDEAAVQKVEEHVQDALDNRGQILCGGKRPDISLQGNFYEPTVINYASDNMKIATEETFGPLAPIFTFKTDEEVIEKANHPQYGLAAYFYTRDLGRAFRVMEAVEFGIVGINDPLPTVAQAPFGGVKESGMGKEGGKYGLRDYMVEKYVSINLG
ncbi:NAD-dependent succinate-semialdehyde dehydrogenase [Paenibacillus xerothermodurans]|uniref:NAD-dependent succinate-semialdehyde dehydrogenase n=1 Tax=Paenibacillus xerothermodurans TaxID=1977292 RepID=A0A2W1NPI7_PAEXE|nr:NAD-dependent succinate-semialdehyde dehydrogenase [Paenibacillus xerothermodurans]PZE21405.1 NAD-dependent succinate-semialdehyde dehydrogenase [Paenibacillus xerothermodurans]